MNRTLRIYLATLGRVVRWKLVGTLALMVLYSLTEGIGFALLLPTLQVAGLKLIVREADATRVVKVEIVADRAPQPVTSPS